MKILLRREGLAIAATALAGALLALAAAQMITLWTSDLGVRRFVELALEDTLASIEDRYRLERMIEDGSVPMCSDADLSRMRAAVVRSSSVAAVGRLQDDHVVCTSWGRLDPPVRLPEPDRVQPSGFKVWGNVENFIIEETPLTMAARGSVIMFLAPERLMAYEPRSAHHAGLLVTRDGSYTFRTIGDPDLVPPDRNTGTTGWADLGPRRTARICADNVDICVIGIHANASILEAPAYIVFGLAFVGFLTFGSLAFAVVNRRMARQSLPEMVRRSVSDNRLSVVYQPLVRLSDGSIVGVEALARMKDEWGRPISPEIFIRIAEESGSIGAITRRVARIALSEMAGRLHKDETFYVSVNVTIGDLIDPSLCEYLDNLTAQFGINRHSVVLELTERSTTDHERLVEGMAVFRKHGYRIFIDDFGTGYSNLAYLNRLPIDGIKLDKVFIATMRSDPISAKIVHDIYAITQTLGVTYIAEGIERRDQAEEILALAPEAIGQGWYFGAAVTASAMQATDALRRSTILPRSPSAAEERIG